MRNTKHGSVLPNGADGVTMQQIMETMCALQETVAESRAQQAQMQEDLATSQARNEELRKVNEDMRSSLHHMQQAGGRVGEDQAPPTPPRAFPMPFSPEIMNTVVSPNLVGVKASFTGKVLNQVVFKVLKNPNPLKDDEAFAVLAVAVLV
ncbi:hypothetical protein VNO80_03176 [Phaseolus coccineus]|uniref:Uncharacterized protein n=1 Tax=Phaseolus coccineus TaxID=3886 RepID=A0AAN9NQU1_PHACN